MLDPEFVQLNASIAATGDILMGYFGKQLQLTEKSSSADYRTKADVECEHAIIRAIEKIFPDYNILAEEIGRKDKGSDYTFIIDPLDGTNNFVLGIPAFVSNVALMKNDEIIYGLIHHPVTRETYCAVKGQGAFVNGQPIKVNSVSDAKRITVSYYCDYTALKQRVTKFKTALLILQLKRFLDLWCPGHCFCALASGRLEAAIIDGIELYDFAAGKLIAMEAGAKITDFSGQTDTEDTNNTFLISNGTAIHDYLVREVTEPLNVAPDDRGDISACGGA